MKKDPFIHQDGKTFVPYPIYPKELIEGVTKNSTKNTDTGVILESNPFGKFFFNLILPGLLKAKA